jgi:hypothetical protein
MVVYIYNPNNQEAEAAESRDWGQPGLHSKTLSQKTKNEPKIGILCYCRNIKASQLKNCWKTFKDIEI